MGSLRGRLGARGRKRTGRRTSSRIDHLERRLHEHFPIVTVIPLTGTHRKRRRVYHFEMILERGSAGNSEDSIAMPQQIRTVSKTRLRGRMGRLSARHLQAKIEHRVLEHLGIESEFAAPESGA